MQVRDVKSFLFDSLDKTYELAVHLEGQDLDSEEVGIFIGEISAYSVLAIRSLYQVSQTKYHALTFIPNTPGSAVSDFAFLLPGFALSQATLSRDSYGRGMSGPRYFISQLSEEKLNVSAFPIWPSIFPPQREEPALAARDWTYPVNYRCWTELQRFWHEGYVLSGWVHYLYGLFLDYCQDDNEESEE